MKERSYSGSAGICFKERICGKRHFPLITNSLLPSGPNASCAVLFQEEAAKEFQEKHKQDVMKLKEMDLTQ